jgi:hypothetical protein
MTIPSLPLTSSNFAPFAFNTDQYNPFHYALRDQTEWFHVEKKYSAIWGVIPMDPKAVYALLY